MISCSERRRVNDWWFELVKIIISNFVVLKIIAFLICNVTLITLISLFLSRICLLLFKTCSSLNTLFVLALDKLTSTCNTNINRVLNYIMMILIRINIIIAIIIIITVLLSITLYFLVFSSYFPVSLKWTVLL